VHTAPRVLGLLLLCATAAWAGPVEVTPSALNVRWGPSTSYGVLAVVYRGDRLDELRREGSWAEVELRDGRRGWVAARFVVARAPSPELSDRLEVRLGALTARAAPRSTAARVAILTLGELLRERDHRDGWVEVELPSGLSGWVPEAGVRALPSASASRSVNSARLNVRSGPGTRFRVLGQLRRGGRVEPLEVDGSWTRFDFGGRRGWVHGDYLSAAADTPPPEVVVSGAGFVQLAASGPGYYSYSSQGRRWGLPRVVYGVLRAARRHAREGGARLGIGTLSGREGGALAGHDSHRGGEDVDLRPQRTDARELPVTFRHSVYSRSRTQAVVDVLRAELSVERILFNDARVRGVTSWPGHDNHLHVRAR
jgi:uncharacterized protein YraI